MARIETNIDGDDQEVPSLPSPYRSPTVVIRIARNLFAEGARAQRTPDGRPAQIDVDESVQMFTTMVTRRVRFSVPDASVRFAIGQATATGEPFTSPDADLRGCAERAVESIWAYAGFWVPAMVAAP